MTQGAAVASRYGAVASLTRSITPFSLNTPHTGSMSYAGAATEIPAAAITIEGATDAALSALVPLVLDRPRCSV